VVMARFDTPYPLFYDVIIKFIATVQYSCQQR
jgi:hypothetical protein